MRDETMSLLIITSNHIKIMSWYRKLTVPMLHHKREQLKVPRTRKKIFHTWRCSQMLRFQTGIITKKQKLYECRKARKIQYNHVLRYIPHMQVHHILEDRKQPNNNVFSTLDFSDPLERSRRHRNRGAKETKILPWSKSSPNGLEEFVLRACFPSTASKV